jgi:uncharacterized delta-60 repeat protein
LTPTACRTRASTATARRSSTSPARGARSARRASSTTPDSPCPTAPASSPAASRCRPTARPSFAAQFQTLQDTTLNPGKTDYRDTDIYVIRLNLDGSLDTSFNTGATAATGVPGILRVDLSDGLAPGAAAGTAPNGDACYGIKIQSDGKIVVEGVKGPDPAEAGRTVKPWAILRINTNGTLDTAGWNAGAIGGGAGVALSPLAQNIGGTAPASVNERQPLIQPDGKIVAAGYTGGSAPYLARFTSTGVLDTTFGGGTGMVQRTESIKVALSAEAYEAVYQKTGAGAKDFKYVMVGYGNRAAGEPAVNALIYRFNSDGTFDNTWGAPGSNGLTTYDRAGGEDRFRELALLPDGRFVATGLSSSVSQAVAAGAPTATPPVAPAPSPGSRSRRQSQGLPAHPAHPAASARRVPAARPAVAVRAEQPARSVRQARRALQGRRARPARAVRRPTSR